MLIERALPSEKDQIVSLIKDSMRFHHSLDKDYYLDPAAVAQSLTEYIANTVDDDAFQVFVARENASKIVACVISTVAEASYFDSSIRRYGVILELYVDPAFRGQRLGEKLLEKAEQYFRDQDLTHAELQMSVFNSQANKFYEKLGYLSRQALLFKKL